MQVRPRRLKSAPLKSSDRVLMLVVWKLDRELPFQFRLDRQLRDVGFAKSKARVFTWGGAHVTYGANAWARTAHYLSREKLLTVTTDARVVIGKVSYIRKVSLSIPFSRNFMTSIARQAFMFI